MNLRNRKLLITIRTITGLIFLFSGISGLLAGPNMQGIPPQMLLATRSLWMMGLFQMIKITEIVSGFMFLIGFLPALAAIFIAPVCIGIIIFDAHIAPGLVISGVVVSLLDIYLGYAYWDKYKALFDRK